METTTIETSKGRARKPLGLRVKLRRNLPLDEFHWWRAPTGGAVCRRRVKERDGKFVAVFSECSNNDGMSVTNGIEDLATELRSGLFCAGEDLTVIEHYPAAARGDDLDTYDLVTFGAMSDGMDGRGNGYAMLHPTWRRITATEASALWGSDLPAVTPDYEAVATRERPKTIRACHTPARRRHRQGAA